MSKILNDTVSKCADLLRHLTQDEAETTAQQIMNMFGYNTGLYPDEPNIRCPNCEFLFTGDITWDDMEGKQGTECLSCGNEIVLDQSGIEMNWILITEND